MNKLSVENIIMRISLWDTIVSFCMSPPTNHQNFMKLVDICTSYVVVDIAKQFLSTYFCVSCAPDYLSWNGETYVVASKNKLQFISVVDN